MSRGMKHRIFAGIFLGLAMMAMTAFAAGANEFDQAIEVTFSTPVQISNNMTLPAGTYWFQSLDAGMSSTPGVVQVLNADRTRVIATASARNVERLRPAEHPFVGVASDQAGQPVAVMGWYYPGRSVGHEVVYSGRQLRQIREQTQSNVPRFAQDY